jgi:hypothetical protein
MGNFIAEMILAPLFDAFAAGLWWVLRTSVRLAFYPLLLLTGWLRLWLRERRRVGFIDLWRQEGFAGLHRFGWQEAAVDVECLVAAGLIVSAGCSIWLVVCSAAGLWFR